MSQKVLSYDLGGTKIEAAVLGSAGDILWSERVPTPKGDYAGTLQAIAQLVERDIAAVRNSLSAAFKRQAYIEDLISG